MNMKTMSASSAGTQNLRYRDPAQREDLAIDDEPMALEKLNNYIDEVSYLELVAACRGVHEAQEVLNFPIRRWWSLPPPI